MIMNSNHTNQTENTEKEKINLADKKSKNLVARISDAIHFNEWIDRMDQKDKKLDPAKRKQKWMIILAGLFFLYLLSFLIPTPKISHQALQDEEKNGAKAPVSSPTVETQKPLTFDMPVDSFETILKKNINEKLPEKK
jgi:hypothetical protein